MITVAMHILRLAATGAHQHSGTVGAPNRWHIPLYNPSIGEKISFRDMELCSAPLSVPKRGEAAVLRGVWLQDLKVRVRVR